MNKFISNLIMQKLQKNMYHYVKSLLSCIGLLSLVIAWNGMPISFPLFIMVSLIGTFAYQVWNAFWHIWLVKLITILILGVITFSIIDNYDILKPFWQNYLEWVTLEHRTIREYIEVYWRLTLAILFITIMPSLYYLQQFLLVRIMLSFIFLILVILSAVFNVPVWEIGVVCNILYLLYVLIEWQYDMNYPVHTALDREKFRSAMANMFIVTALCFGALSIIPYSDNPISVPFAKKIWNHVVQVTQPLYDSVVSRFGNGTGNFEVNFSGYSESSILGGTIFESNEEAMIVDVKDYTDSNLYLIGNIQGIYDNNAWSSTNYSPYDAALEYKWDTLELLYALYRTGNLQESDYFIDLQPMRIEYLKLNTKSIFYPSKTINHNLSLQAFEQNDENMRFLNLQSEGTIYELDYFNLNLNSELMTDLIKSQEYYHYNEYFEIMMEDMKEEWEAKDQEFNSANMNARSFSYGFIRELNAYHPELSSLTIPDNLELELRKRADLIYQNYMQMPIEYQDEIRALAEQITESYETNYEKLKAIEQYLSQYTYTLTPELPPNGVDAIQYFLFDSKEGYCTYFASAFVLLSRSLGYPSRYVSGFCVPTHDEELSRYTVMDKNAHAWPEVYMEGFGWIPFEPTAGFREVRYTPWEVLTEDEKEKESASNITFEATEEDEEIYDSINLSEYMNEEELLENMKWHPAWVIGGIAGMILLAVVGYVPWKRMRYRILYKKSSMEEKFFLDTKFLMLILSYLHMEVKIGETFLQFVARVRRRYPESDMMAYATQFMNCRYGNDNVTDELLKEAERLRGYFMERVKEVHGKASFVRMMVVCYVRLG